MSAKLIKTLILLLFLTSVFLLPYSLNKCGAGSFHMPLMNEMECSQGSFLQHLSIWQSTSMANLPTLIINLAVIIFLTLTLVIYFWPKNDLIKSQLITYNSIRDQEIKPVNFIKEALASGIIHRRHFDFLA